MLGVVDYGSGNFTSVCSALDHLGISYMIIREAESLLDCSHVILPGVGAFHDCMNSLGQRGLQEPLRVMLKENVFFFLGICVGHQILADVGSEFKEGPGLGVIAGRTDRLSDENSRLPHVGWNELDLTKPSPLFDGIDHGATVYFVHSYAIQETPEEYVIAETNYNQRIIAAVNKGTVYGVQFHPEKSQSVGLRVLKNFSELS